MAVSVAIASEMRMANDRRISTGFEDVYVFTRVRIYSINVYIIRVKYITFINLLERDRESTIALGR